MAAQIASCYLSRIADASLAAPEPTSKFIISHKRKHMHPGRDASVNVLTVQYLNELEGYRTDAHSAAWMAHNVAGHAWDAFDQLVQSGSLSREDLYAKVKRRGITKEVHAGDVKELIGRGWVEEGSGVYQITSDGKQVRAKAEAETERLFFAPWSCLNESELEELSDLATQLRDGLRNVEG